MNENISPQQWREIIASRGSIELTVVSDSMEPLIMTDSTIKFIALPTKIESGMVIAFSNPKINPSIVVHRYIGNGKFRGDNRLFADRDKVADEQLLGLADTVTIGIESVKISHQSFSVARTIQRLKILIRTILRKICK